MATLADSFLQDLADLDDEEEDLTKNTETDFKSDSNSDPIPNECTHISDFLLDESFIKLIQILKGKSEENNSDSLDKKDEANDDSKADLKTEEVIDSNNTVPSDESFEEEENKLIKQANESITKIDVDILKIYSIIRDIYSLKFPELESLVLSPLEYISVVLRIKNETDLTLIDLNDILPNTIVMAITVASSMTTGSALPQSDIDKITNAGNEALQLAEYRKIILTFLESRMDFIAPNISAIIGSALTARLITHVGSITNLARMPAQNILNIGIQNNFNKSNTTTGIRAQNLVVGGSITTATNITSSIIYNCDIVQMTPLNKRNRALKLVAGKVGLAARVDSFHEAPTGEIGVMLRQQILRSLLKIQEPPPAPIKKALSIPDDVPKSRRGGRRHRRAKAKYGLSELRKEANRMIFGPEAEDEVDPEGRLGLGMVTKSLGHGKLRLHAKQIKLAKAAAKKKKGTITANEPTTGFSSSVIFTPLQGIELCNPSAIKQKPQELGYFNTNTVYNDNT